MTAMNAPLPLRQIAPDVCVAPQLTPEAMAEAAAMGFKSVVNNRPDFEHGPDQPTSASIEAGGLLDELPRPILMFCRSGARSTRLVLLARQPG